MTHYFYLPAYFEATKSPDTRKAEFAKEYIADYCRPEFLFDCAVPGFFKSEYLLKCCNYLATMDEVTVPDWFK